MTQEQSPPEKDAPWHCGQCVGGWDCKVCKAWFSEPGDQDAPSTTVKGA